MIKYLQLKPEARLSDIFYLKPFRSIVIIEEVVTESYQLQVSSWLVKSGCLYMMAWGKDCSSWNDSVDQANLKLFDYAIFQRKSLL